MLNLTLIIGNKNYSSWSLRPWILLKHFQIPFTEKRVALFTETTAKALSAYNSNYKVPILKDGDFVVWDSLAILEYISETYLDGKGWPNEQHARSFARSVSAEMHSGFTHVRSELPMNCRKKFEHIQLSDAAEREVERIKTLWRQCRSQFGQNGQWLFGEYSIADAMFAPISLRFESYNIPLVDVEQAYLQNVLAQPSIIEWITAGAAEKEIIAQGEVGV